MDPGSPAAETPSLVAGLQLFAVNGQPIQALGKDEAFAVFKEAPYPRKLLFTPTAARLEFEVTMNKNYRKPGRVYRMQVMRA